MKLVVKFIMMSLLWASTNGEHTKPLRMSSHFGNFRESKRDSGRQLTFPDLYYHDPELDTKMTDVLDDVPEIEPRGPKIDIAWAGTQVILNPNPAVKVLNLGSIACTLTTVITTKLQEAVPPAINYGCSAISFVSLFTGLFTGKSTVQAAYNRYRSLRGAISAGSAAEEWIEMQTYWRSGNQGMWVRGDSGDYESEMDKYMKLEEIFYELAYDSMMAEEVGYLFHDPFDNYSVLPFTALKNATFDNPALIGISHNLTVEHPLLKMWWDETQDRPGTGMVASNMLVSEPDHGENRRQVSCEEPYHIDYGTEEQQITGCNPTKDDGVAHGMRYAENFYGNEQQWEQTDYDVGGQSLMSNGAFKLAGEITVDAANNNWYDACMCKLENGIWTSTGALQYTMGDEPYNGYDVCWSGGCGEEALYS